MHIQRPLGRCQRIALRRTFVALFFLVLTALRAGATLSTVIDLGPPGVFHDNKTVSFSGLNGLPLNGETLSLDFTFANNFGIRLLTPDGFSLVVDLLTDVDGELKYLETGYFLDKQGNQLGARQSSGTDVIGSSLPISLLLEEPSQSGDLYGAHFDFTIPSIAGANVTGGDLRLQTGRSASYGIGILPEKGSTLTLLGIGILALAIGLADSGRSNRAEK